jgi:hypothetical protein
MNCFAGNSRWFPLCDSHRREEHSRTRTYWQRTHCDMRWNNRKLVFACQYWPIVQFCFYFFTAFLFRQHWRIRGQCDSFVETESPSWHEQLYSVQMWNSRIPPWSPRLFTLCHSDQLQVQVHLVWWTVHISRVVSQDSGFKVSEASYRCGKSMTVFYSL